MTTLYKLEWTNDNNPNGWLEPTTYCQLKCPGCYRGLAENNPKRTHINLKQMKKQVDWFVQHRNVQSISIAGGEPLCYPELDQLVSYITSKGLKTKIYSNGIALNEKRLLALKEAGVTEIIVHLDKYQRNQKSEQEVNASREKYCQLFRKVGGVNLGFIMPISKNNIRELPVLSAFFRKNSDIVSLVVFTVYKEMLPDQVILSSNKTSMDEVKEAVRKNFGVEFCAYLDKEKSDGKSWLLSVAAYSKGKYLGSFDGDFYRRIQRRYYAKKKKHFITVRNKPFETIKLLKFLNNRSGRQIFGSALLNRVGKMHTQSVLLIDPPELTNRGWDLCEGCPDAMLHKGTLVPSCLLERIKCGERVLTH